MGLHLGLDPGKDLTKAVVQYFARKPPSLLILDNLETTWEPLHTRGGVEELLSLLADIPHLALMVGLGSYLDFQLLIPERSQCEVLKDLPKSRGRVRFYCP
jgi:hypothetical protein